MQELGFILGGVEKVKLIRFFLANDSAMYDIDEIEEKLKIKKDILKDALSDFEKADLIAKSKERFAIEYESGNSTRSGVREYTCYALNKKFRFLESLRAFMFDFKNANRSVLLERFRPIGRCKLMILSGVFIGSDKSRLDILYVGEAIKDNLATKLVADLNIEIGIKLGVHILDLEEFNYRYKMYDRFLRDVLAEDNEVLIDKMSGV